MADVLVVCPEVPGDYTGCDADVGLETGCAGGSVDSEVSVGCAVAVDSLV